MDRFLALDGRTGNALTAFWPAARVRVVPGDLPMPAALVAVWCGFPRRRRRGGVISLPGRSA
ncbi:hypothetical protein ACFFWE_30435 [Sphaerisporangium melleum]|uniref:hypothetical protein n=1 Tax=Sphaerisporangium melleum TaxID=321316 RepID=UPI001667EB83|nr:hypothetical protein [Sphaerisporangium melleum]